MMIKTLFHFYKYLISCAFLFLVSASMLVGQTVKTEYFDYEVKGQSFKGSFQYNLETRQLVDILKTGVADFKGVRDEDLREVYLKIVNVEMASVEHQKIKLFFDKRWRTSTMIINELSNSQKTFSVMMNKSKSIIYKASKNGAASMTVGYSYIKKSDAPNQLSLNFKVAGIGNAIQEAPKKEVVKPKPEPIPVTVEPEIETTTVSDEVAWKNTTRSGRTTDFKDFIKGYPKSKYVPVAKNAIEKLQKRETEEKKKIVETSKKKELKEEQTPEELAWIRAKKADDPANYEAFVMEFPESRLIKKAKERIELLAPLEVRYVRDGNTYLVNFQNADQPKVIKVFPDDREITMKMVGEELEITVNDNRKYTFTVKDEMDKTADFEIDNGLLPLTGSIRTEGKNLLYTAEGGMPPYSIAIKDVNGIVIVRMNLPDTEGQLNFKTVGRDLNGTYIIDLLDSRKNESATFQGIEIKQGNKGLKRIILIVGLALGLGILIFTVRHFYNKVHATEEEEDFDFSDEPLYEEEVEGEGEKEIEETNEKES